MLRISKLANDGIGSRAPWLEIRHSIRSVVNLTFFNWITYGNGTQVTVDAGALRCGRLQGGVNGCYVLSCRPEDISPGMVVSSADGVVETSECSGEGAKYDQ